MRSRRVHRTAVAIAILGSALLSAACFGGGQQAAQATPTGGTAVTTGSPSPAASPPAAKPPGGLPSPAASPSPARPSGSEETYTVEVGDTLGTIAQKFYGDQTQWRRIYEANRSAIGDNPDAIAVGTQIRIPPKE